MASILARLMPLLPGSSVLESSVCCAWFGAVLACVNALRSWSTPNRWIWTKLHDTALALACLSLVWFAITWNLMNFNIHY